MIGKTAVVDSEIDNIKLSGYVKQGGDFWKAISKDGSVIEKGKLVVIESIEGNTVTVSLSKE